MWYTCCFKKTSCDSAVRPIQSFGTAQRILYSHLYNYCSHDPRRNHVFVVSQLLSRYHHHHLAAHDWQLTVY